MGVLDHQIEQGCPADFLRHGEGAGLVDPHQRRMDDERRSRPSVSATCMALRFVAAIGIAGIIGLAHAGDDMPGAAAIGQRAGKAEEDQLRPGTKVVGKPLSAISIAISRVSAVSEIAASASSLTT